MLAVCSRVSAEEKAGGAELGGCVWRLGQSSAGACCVPVSEICERMQFRRQ